MKGLKLKWGAGRLRRTALTLGVAGATVGGVLLIAAPAQAFLGTDPTPGTVVLSPTSGPVSTQATFTTTDGCPSGFQTSAVLEEVVFGTTTVTQISGTVNLSGGAPITVQEPLADTMGNLLADANVPNGGSTEWVLKCSSEASGLGTVPTQAVYYQNVLVSLSPDGSSYSISAPAAATPTNTIMSASPNPAAAGASVTLSATVTGAGNPSGTVTFFNGASIINSTPASVTYVGNTGTATFIRSRGGFTAKPKRSSPCRRRSRPS